MKNQDLKIMIDRLHGIAWKWDKRGVDAIAESIGLTDREPRSNYVRFRMPRTSLRPSYQASGLEVSRFYAWDMTFEVGGIIGEDDFYEKLAEQYELFEVRFNDAASQISAVMGAPVFQGGPQDAGYEQLRPEIRDGLGVANWEVGNGQLVLMFSHGDKEMPVSIELFVIPPKMN